MSYKASKSSIRKLFIGDHVVDDMERTFVHIVQFYKDFYSASSTSNDMSIVMWCLV